MLHCNQVSPAVVEIMGPKYVGVMTLTCHGYVTSSVTWPPFDSPYPISYWWSFGTAHLFVSVFEILGPKHISIALQSPIWNGLSLQVIRVIDVKMFFLRFNFFYFVNVLLYFKTFIENSINQFEKHFWKHRNELIGLDLNMKVAVCTAALYLLQCL